MQKNSMVHRDRARSELRSDVSRSGVPVHLHAGLERYVIDHIEPGGFLLAVLSNDLDKAAMYADVTSWEGLPLTMRFIRNHLTDQMWGSKAIVELWLAGQYEWRE